MIEYRQGDILQAETEAIINTVNCVGVMGRGIALQFKNAYPDNFKAYAASCKTKQVVPGKMFVFETGQLTNPRYIINFPTKRHWKGKSRLEDIVAGLDDLVAVIRKHDIRSIAIPPLGSGLGGLDWQDVKPLIESAVQPLESVQIAIYDPNGAPSSERMVHKTEVPKMTAGRAALVELMQRYLNGLLDPFISLLELHKLMYFMQESGEPLRLKYQKAHYGPYAENLRHVLNAIEGHMISGYSDGGDMPDKQLSLVPGVAEEAKTFLEQQEETYRRFQKVSDLVEGFESPFGLELLSTVHWTMQYESLASPEDVTDFIYAWNERKRQFTPRQISLAVDTLHRKGWLTSSVA
ncbi:type II toxin-antitoxin system antitoxin DNA ADP-ribosyl glycohydrolase DarG [Pectobacterium parmentieri]|uniref:type II toxin-antitoxin system antitoxin DNA ADP-ribosyl glycohydrolase DarG n=1 Tax=Pectobacterium parmentieri TaxID=1905730 RepID=UPI000CDE44B3|nr:macro domain-containing protein [Pectobacterium parmentieri]AYH06837.1 Appr-1-p processing protein [Pectobacterium parmentieri]AYH15647.1 Appr-1-p processing protein [Pectobacterium parmentieri]AYH24356.1 Appr-1-p processing protein [Pectobacterium parmentieri]MBN3180039.1 macro domain-containing protein [Pectobacterium parmentieri]POW23956.1 Appr-1-p processing protein [Pectobacterium parmentieri]